MITIIILKNNIEFVWEITGPTEELLLSMDEAELQAYFGRKYSELSAELEAMTDARVRVLDVEVDIYDDFE